MGGEASKTAQLNSLKREVDTQHQMYQTLLVQQSEANLSSSVPVNPIRIVEESARPEEPYGQTGAQHFVRHPVWPGAGRWFIFIRERMDSSILTPGHSRRMFNA